MGKKIKENNILGWGKISKSIQLYTSLHFITKPRTAVNEGYDVTMCALVLAEISTT